MSMPGGCYSTGNCKLRRDPRRFGHGFQYRCKRMARRIADRIAYARKAAGWYILPIVKAEYSVIKMGELTKAYDAYERNREEKKGRFSNFLNKSKKGLAGLVLGGALVLGAGSEEARGDTVYSFSQLFDSSDSQNVRNYDSSYSITGEFTNQGQTPTQQNYDFGGFTNVEGGAIVTSYMENDSEEGYPGVLTGRYDRGELGSGGKPDFWLVVQKLAQDSEGKPYIGDLTGGDLTIDSENNVWTNDMIEYNGVKGAAEQMPGCTSSGTLEIDNSINLIPEPATVGLIALGGLGMLFGKNKRENRK